MVIVVLSALFFMCKSAHRAQNASAGTNADLTLITYELVPNISSNVSGLGHLGVLHYRKDETRYFLSLDCGCDQWNQN